MNCSTTELRCCRAELRKSCFGLIVSIARRIRQAPSDPTPKANTLETMETISNITVGGVPLNTLAIVITIGVSVVWLWSRWDARQARKRQVKRHQAWIQEERDRARAMEQRSVKSACQPPSQIPRHKKSVGAGLRAGTPCRSPPAAGKRRCRMHGGSRSSNQTRFAASTRNQS